MRGHCILFVCTILIGCSAGSSGAPGVGLAQNASITEPALGFSTAGQPLQFNAFTAAHIAVNTQLFYPFTMTASSTFRVLSEQFWFDCSMPNAGSRCSGYTDFQILDAATNAVVFDKVQTDTPYSLTPGKAYVLRVDLEYADSSGANYALYFSVWQGDSTDVHAVMTCQSGSDTILWSSQSLQLKSASGTSTLFDSGTGCGTKVDSSYQYYGLFEIGPAGSFEGTDLTLSNMTSLTDTGATVYEAEVTANASNGQPVLVCESTDPSNTNVKILEQLPLSNCAATVQ